MDEISDINSENLNLTDKDLFTKIWTSPRQVFKYINDNHYDKYVTVLLILSGISRSFDRASMKNMGDKMSIWAILGFCIILGGLLGWISYYFYAALVSWTGKWLKGKGDTSSILRIISYAMIPSIIALIFLIPQIGIYGVEIFKENSNITSTGWISYFLFDGFMLLEFILGIWTIVFCVVGLSEVQKFSVGKSILNLLLPAIVIIIPILGLILLFTSF
ncbi:MAG: YIP1 family protein [Saprospiraceae bacterium]|nr:YIP1 family protein [Saprospiraceae bacterium]